MEENNIQKREDILFEHISRLIDESRRRIKTTVNTAMVYTYYSVGKYIVEDELQGERRATYGKSVLKDLSIRLTMHYGKGWSLANLKNAKQFYLLYMERLNTVYPIQTGKAKHCLTNLINCTQQTEPDKNNSAHDVDQIYPFTLSWSHYLVLMRIKNDDERCFYEIESRKQDWSVRQLQRQYSSSLYERLALSRNKKEVMRLAKEGQTVEKPDDVIKDPLSLEFLGLKADDSYSETKLESAIINKMRDFLLEMGKGFLFEARQKRFTFDEEHFYVDLVFYNRLLQCYCLIDLKNDKLTHQDLGQMQMYVNYFDRYVKQDFEKPTIGILLCKKKNDALVDLTLPKDANIYASAYELYLPDKDLLQSKVKEWIEEFEENEPDAENISKEQL
ncbi:PDDEXK nuclease domain-containing protein [Parabacteroides pacaensis]|uniref:PDDEXK nuclease domain-containing protein n=1 Tax=Parabacteroides pacaensis TaxID=2086575 RepID=UPI000D0E4021|nr:PDDEXK nuclease domain-containing protein [Parabacteroides pacaensis]